MATILGGRDHPSTNGVDERFEDDAEDLIASDEDDLDSLFGSEHSEPQSQGRDLIPGLDAEEPIASSAAPDIPGLFFFPDMLPQELLDKVLQEVAECGYFSIDQQQSSGVEDAIGYNRNPRNQVMLFGRPHLAEASGEVVKTASSTEGNHRSKLSGLPTWAEDLISRLEILLNGTNLSQETLDLLFPNTRRLSRQLILNLYMGGDGLFPHIDLVNRFGDGIILCSFGPKATGTVMDFYHDTQPTQHLFLPSGSVLVLSKEARYDWKHGITARTSDLVERTDSPPSEPSIARIQRSIRLSITIRTMLPGADVVGE